MDAYDIKARIETNLPDATVEVVGDGVHFQALIVSPAFTGKTLVQREQMVNALFKEELGTGALHALSMRNLTPDQWARERQ